MLGFHFNDQRTKLKIAEPGWRVLKWGALWARFRDSERRHKSGKSVAPRQTSGGFIKSFWQEDGAGAARHRYWEVSGLGLAILRSPVLPAQHSDIFNSL